VSHVAAGSPPAVVLGGSAHPPGASPPLPADPAFLLVAKQSRDLNFRPSAQLFTKEILELTLKNYTSKYSLSETPLCMPSTLFVQNLEEWKANS
jgi:hypothetical protein